MRELHLGHFRVHVKGQGMSCKAPCKAQWFDILKKFVVNIQKKMSAMQYKNVYRWIKEREHHAVSIFSEETI